MDPLLELAAELERASMQFSIDVYRATAKLRQSVEKKDEEHGGTPGKPDRMPLGD